MTWDQDIQQASFRGIEFGVMSVRDAIGRRFAVHEYPNRNGAEIDDLGREPRPTEIEAVLRGPEYLADLGALMQITDLGESGVFQHPLLGSWTARIERLEINHSHERRDEVSLSISLREDGVGTELPDVFSVTAAKDEVETAAAAVTTEAASADITVTDTVQDAIDDATDMVDDVDQTLSDLTNRLTQQIKRANDAIETIENVEDEVTSFETVTAIRRMVLQSKRLKERIERLQPAVIDYNVAATTSVTILALALYGDSARSSDILRLNRILNPFAIPAGTTLRVYSS